ncbi:MAG: cytidine deaminase [Pirellulaceae bacterium]|jgi:cytidine deaminase|nr:cytidine deaminase [Pirellulaceae bacterium]
MKEEQLEQAAFDVQRRAYAPYSNFPVGAAIRTKSGEVYTGCNVENASYGLTICAERAALCAMVAGGQREIESVAIASLGGVAPCGACRQALSEFGLDYSVLLLDSQTQTLRQRWTMQELLPGAFRLAF